MALHRRFALCCAIGLSILGAAMVAATGDAESPDVLPPPTAQDKASSADVDGGDSSWIPVLRDEECWDNELNLTWPTAFSCSVVYQNLGYEMGGVESGSPVPAHGQPAASGTQYVKATDLELTYPSWRDIANTTGPIRGFTACANFRNTFLYTNASADANSPTPASDEVHFVDAESHEFLYTLKLNLRRRRAAIASTYNYIFVIGGVDENGTAVQIVERYDRQTNAFVEFAMTDPICDCAVATHQDEIFLVCSNCSTGAYGQLGFRDLFYTVCLLDNTMRRLDGWTSPPDSGVLVSISGAAIAQYAVFLVFYANNTNPVVQYWDLYLEQLHTIATGWLTVPRIHGSAFVSLNRIWYAGGMYFPAPNTFTDIVTQNTDSVPVIQKAIFTPVASTNLIPVGSPIQVTCDQGLWFRVAETPNCHTPIANSSDVACQGVDTVVSVQTAVPGKGFGCMSRGTCQIPVADRRPCGYTGIDFRQCNHDMGCCFDSELNQCFQYAAPNATQTVYFMCAELEPFIIQGSPQTVPPNGPPLNGPTGPAKKGSIQQFMTSTTGVIVIVAVAVLIVGLLGFALYGVRGRSAWARRHGAGNGGGTNRTNELELIHGKYHVIRKLGQGGFGTVFLVRRRTDNREFALKYIPCNTDEDRAFALKEFELVRQSQGHPNMITIHDMFMNWADDNDPHATVTVNGEKPSSSPKKAPDTNASPLLHTNRRFVCIVMTYCPGGDLAHFIVNSVRTNTAIPQDWLLQVLARQMIGVLDHLHSRPSPIVHRDLKPENVLLSTDRQQIVLTDFGLAQEQTNTYMSTRAGSLHYVAPECWKKHYGSAVDMWAVGCILYAAATGRATATTARVMFHDAKEKGFSKDIRNDLTVGTKNRYTDDYASFVLALLQVDHRKRLTAPAALSWLDDFRDGVPRRASSRNSAVLTRDTPKLRKDRDSKRSRHSNTSGDKVPTPAPTPGVAAGTPCPTNGTHAAQGDGAADDHHNRNPHDVRTAAHV